ncbi:hypothetical protein EZS27_028554 [termite gut metagenome]|uniref:Uncharacterized protein n=1 Tax=termite gut metagenome TaxID=433724 RepID=A0A5J4QLR4_9ZZZZ
MDETFCWCGNKIFAQLPEWVYLFGKNEKVITKNDGYG